MCPPSNSYVEVLTSVPQNANLFGDQVFTEVDEVVRVGPNPSPFVRLMTYKNKKFEHRDTHRVKPV